MAFLSASLTMGSRAGGPLPLVVSLAITLVFSLQLPRRSETSCPRRNSLLHVQSAASCALIRQPPRYVFWWMLCEMVVLCREFQISCCITFNFSSETGSSNAMCAMSHSGSPIGYAIFTAPRTLLILSSISAIVKGTFFCTCSYQTEDRLKMS